MFPRPERGSPSGTGPIRGVAAVVASLALVSACASGELEDPGDAEPRDDPPASPADVPADAVPPPLDADPLWTAPFSADPKPVGEGFVGLAMPDDEHSDLRFLGVDADGTTRWSTPRNPSCTAFTATRADGTALVVLLDSDAAPEEGLAATRVTAAAYDPVDGTKVWGPVDVPGTLAGPGLVFAETGGSVMSDGAGPRVALSAVDGRVVADERASDTTVLHEHEGALLTHAGGAYRVEDTASDEELWTSDDLAPPDDLDPDADAVRLVYGPRPVSDSSAAVVFGWEVTESDTDGEEGADAYTVHDLRTGTRLATLDGDHEPRLHGAPNGTTTVVSGTRDGTDVVLAVAGTDLVWDTEDTASLRLDQVTGEAVYLSDGATRHVLDLATGEELGSGDWAAPTAAAPDGTALVRVDSDGEGDRFVAVPTRLDDDTADAAEGDV
ncbi:hypothetical protein J4H86_18045 [Spiractinospora alimapuensis]|uniref:hypothetical protein n=1 Tax=Spiractinospora alimapuensis TaxID=2820884 RepID=UPI001F31B364|nr:hypothetical protein [Spiractinospora alimapuensis]QVQ50768.1 hypothetical protein J4H86_18045 [Spiractinospora alimapuensis]